MDYTISRESSVCAACRKAIAVDEEFCSAVYDRGSELERKDYCLACWKAVDPWACFSFWKKRKFPEDVKPKRFVDDEVLVEFFEKLAGEEEPSKVNFRYMLALLLLRKRILKYVGTNVRDGNRKLLVVRQRGLDDEIEVIDPQLTEIQAESVKEEMGAVLNLDIEAMAQEAARAQTASPEEPARAEPPSS